MVSKCIVAAIHFATTLDDECRVLQNAEISIVTIHVVDACWLFCRRNVGVEVTLLILVNKRPNDRFAIVEDGNGYAEWIGEICRTSGWFPMNANSIHVRTRSNILGDNRVPVVYAPFVMLCLPSEFTLLDVCHRSSSVTVGDPPRGLVQLSQSGLRLGPQWQSFL